MDMRRVDFHTLLYDPRRVADFLKGDDIPPLFAEIGLVGGGEPVCRLSGQDSMAPGFGRLETGLLRQRLTEMGRFGVKRVQFAGQGDPYRHDDLPEIVNHAKASGLDCAVVTSGLCMRPEVLERHMAATAWIRVDLDPGSPGTAAACPGAGPDERDAALANLEAAVGVRRRLGSACALGARLLILPENANKTLPLAATLRDRGLDYLVVEEAARPHHGQGGQPEAIGDAGYAALIERLRALTRDGFRVVVRQRPAPPGWGREGGRRSCLVLPFGCFCDASGTVWGCGAHRNDPRLAYGNMYEDTFETIWAGTRRAAALARGREAGVCQAGCPRDADNRYLRELLHPGLHANFI